VGGKPSPKKGGEWAKDVQDPREPHLNSLEGGRKMKKVQNDVGGEHFQQRKKASFARQTKYPQSPAQEKVHSP